MLDSEDENYAVTPILPRVDSTPPHKKLASPKKKERKDQFI